MLALTVLAASRLPENTTVFFKHYRDQFLVPYFKKADKATAKFQQYLKEPAFFQEVVFPRIQKELFKAIKNQTIHHFPLYRYNISKRAAQHLARDAEDYVAKKGENSPMIIAPNPLIPYITKVVAEAMMKLKKVEAEENRIQPKLIDVKLDLERLAKQLRKDPSRFTNAEEESNPWASIAIAVGKEILKQAAIEAAIEAGKKMLGFQQMEANYADDDNVIPPFVIPIAKEIGKQILVSGAIDSIVKIVNDHLKLQESVNSDDENVIPPFVIKAATEFAKQIVIDTVTSAVTDALKKQFHFQQSQVNSLEVDDPENGWGKVIAEIAKEVGKQVAIDTISSGIQQFVHDRFGWQEAETNGVRIPDGLKDAIKDVVKEVVVKTVTDFINGALKQVTGNSDVEEEEDGNSWGKVIVDVAKEVAKKVAIDSAVDFIEKWRKQTFGWQEAESNGLGKALRRSVRRIQRLPRRPIRLPQYPRPVFL
ncbi:hypothetical protein TVAG_309660 [Trichomonas vaginalis G3]|uniref:Uncharacterized protein n=1 Tax=Trichomonas vaginalis (strain ATCC PRA-98 / G3) TaxID=412133 RepID=A2FTZ7_TRIV3|nr:hypothetical protein TVAGG3_0708390 [Trichomonas vaginalis G3]EAX91614.1 hypothetical protein TVAG_309660 [Trichomonas vaginalis G3]KAI5509718.1 hypothetical protein TVAGG3_0708390 [Trichomonas vaginalis G3]|eukprot:XP_001304544.1 hypothetical protein [Trichomonas vaginalis G3]